MKKIAEIIINKCVKPSKTDNVLIVTDTVKRHLADSIFNYCIGKNLNVSLIIMLPTEADGQEPGPVVSSAILDADVVIAVTKWSISHTKAMVDARKKGVKVVSMPAAEEAMLKRCVPVDYTKMSILTKKIAGFLTNSENVKITSSAGTDLSLSCKGFNAYVLDGIAKSGQLINLPDGEAAIGIENADGILIIDGSMPPDQKNRWGVIGRIKDPIKLMIKDCKVVEIEGKKEANILKNMLSEFDESVYKLAELGVGTNAKAKISGNVTEDEKILGTVHVALGDNTSFGGDNVSPLHLDGVVIKPTLKINGRVILEDGILKI